MLHTIALFKHSETLHEIYIELVDAVGFLSRYQLVVNDEMLKNLKSLAVGGNVKLCSDEIKVMRTYNRQDDDQITVIFTTSYGWHTLEIPTDVFMKGINTYVDFE